MKESELGSTMATQLRKLGWTVFKLHNDGMQRGLPDYLAWGRGTPVVTIELKVAGSLAEALTSLTPGQESVLRSLALTETGAIVAYGNDDCVGIGRMMGRWDDMVNAVLEAPQDGTVRVSGKADAGRVLAAKISEAMRIL